MKVKSVCGGCLQKTSVEGNAPRQNLEVEFVDGRVIGTCEQGHRTSIAVQQADFEILFELGGMALLDGYSREAVTSMAAALERAYAFYIRLVLEAHTVPPDTLKALRGQLTKRSERELGAFCALWVLLEKSAPPVLTTAQITFRNECTHQGAIPSHDRAIEYGQAVLGVIDAILGSTKKHDAIARKIIVDRIKEKWDNNAYLVTVSIGTMLAMKNGLSLKERLEQLKTYRHYAWSV